MSDINCPYCDAELNICHDDGFGYEEGVKHQMECSTCKKNFVFETSISFYYEPEKADCLNDNKHDWCLTHAYPNYFSKMECSMCGDSRELTDDEKNKYKIISFDDYVKSIK